MLSSLIISGLILLNPIYQPGASTASSVPMTSVNSNSTSAISRTSAPVSTNPSTVQTADSTIPENPTTVTTVCDRQPYVTICGDKLPIDRTPPVQVPTLPTLTPPVSVVNPVIPATEIPTTTLVIGDISEPSTTLTRQLPNSLPATGIDLIRGIEGIGAMVAFGAFCIWITRRRARKCQN